MNHNRDLEIEGFRNCRVGKRSVTRHRFSRVYSAAGVTAAVFFEPEHSIVTVDPEIPLIGP